MNPNRQLHRHMHDIITAHCKGAVSKASLIPSTVFIDKRYDSRNRGAAKYCLQHRLTHAFTTLRALPLLLSDCGLRSMPPAIAEGFSKEGVTA